MTPPEPSPELADGLVAVARYRLGLPLGEPAEIRAFYPDDVEGLWIVPLFDGNRGRVIALMTESYEVAAHAGLARAAARLRDLDILGRKGPWATDNIRPLLDAVGGLTPGYPRYPSEKVERQGDGAIRLILEEPASWVRFAAAGGRGAPPPEGGGSGGIRAPEPVGRMVCDVGSDYRIAWTYELDGNQLGEFTGDMAQDRPDQVPALLAESVLATARTQVASPLAMPAGPVLPAEGGDLGRWRVEFLGLESVLVDEGKGR